MQLSNKEKEKEKQDMGGLKKWEKCKIILIIIIIVSTDFIENKLLLLLELIHLIIWQN